MIKLIKNISLFLLFTVCFALTAIAQKPELKIQKGHGEIFSATYAAYSPDGKYVATGGGNNIILWEVASGRELKTFIGFTPVCFSNDSKSIAYVCQDSASTYYTNIKISDLYSGNTKAILTGHKNIVTTLAFSPNDEFLVSGSSDKTIRVWNNINYGCLHVLKSHTEWVTQVCFMKDGKTFASCSGDKTVIFWDTETGQELSKTVCGQAMLLNLNFSTDENIFATYESQLGSPATIRFFNTQTKKEIKSIEGLPPILFTKDGKSFIYELEKERSLVKINLKTWEQEAIYKGHTDYIFGLCQSPDGKYLVSTGQDKKIIFWETATCSKIEKFNTNIKSIRSLKISDDNNFLIDGYGFLDLHFWEIKNPKVLSRQKFYEHFAISPDSKYMACYSKEKGKLILYNLSKMEEEKELLKTWFIDDISFSPDGKLLAFAEEKEIKILNLENNETWIVKKADRIHEYFVSFSHNGKFLLYGGNDEYIHCWDIEKKKKKFKIKAHVNSVHKAIFSNDDKYIISGSSDYTAKLWDFETKKLVLTYPKQSHSITSLCLTADGNKVVLGTYGTEVHSYHLLTGKDFLTLKGNVSSVHDVCCSSNGKYILTGSDDGQVKFFDALTGELVVTLLALNLPGNEYIAYTPDGYYMSTKKGTEAVHFVKDNKVYLFDQYDLQYNRPDIILDRISYVDSSLIDTYKKAYLKRLKRMNFTADMFSPDFHCPEISILKKDSIPLTITHPDFTFNVIATDTKYKLDRLNIYQNDVPVYGINGINLRDKQIETFSKNISIKLVPGKNKIQVSCLNEKGAESIREAVEINYNPGDPIEKPSLYILSIGVSEFQQKQFNLTYAAKDALDVCEQFKLNQNNFSAVNTLTLVNEKATRENILNAGNFLRATKPNDEVIVFIASHGLLDTKLDYYFATNNVDFSSPAEKGLSYEELEGLVDGISALKKIIFIDACHSGEFDKDDVELVASNETQQSDVKFRGFDKLKTKENALSLANAYELMKELFTDLRKSSGAIVISSASGKEYAYESSQWKNGVFTYALMEGLKTGNADANQDKQINISEIKNYISDRVQKLTGGKQNPTSRKENLEFDFRIW